jgi:hypothetical protein
MGLLIFGVVWCLIWVISSQFTCDSPVFQNTLAITQFAIVIPAAIFGVIAATLWG